MKVGETDDRLLKQKQSAAANEGMLRKQTMAAQKGNDMVDQQEIDGIVKEIYEDIEEMRNEFKTIQDQINRLKKDPKESRLEPMKATPVDLTALTEMENRLTQNIEQQTQQQEDIIKTVDNL